MEEQTAQYKLNKKIKDDQFNVDLIARYTLSLQVSKELFRICITDSVKNRCLLLEDYQLLNIQTPDQLLEQLRLLYEDHALLQAGFWKDVRLAIKNTCFSLIPFSLFEQQYLKDYLHINCHFSDDNNDEVYYYRQNRLDAVNIFSADKKIIEWFNQKYPSKKVKIVHHTSPLIEGVLLSGNNKQDLSVVINVENQYMTILVKRSKNLEYCNSFNYISPEDFVYFTMFVMDQLQINPEVVPVTIFGEITPDSVLYKKLYKYIKNISFGDKPSSLHFGYYFDEVFDHKFFDLYSMHLCE